VPISRGEPWGRTGPLPDGAVLVRSDAEARAVLEEARAARRPYPVLGLLGGDLCRTLGGRGDAERLGGEAATIVSVDLGEALVDGRFHLFVAHCVVRGRSWWRGRIVAAMNAQYLGDWDVAPRSHPNDGRLDVVEAEAALSLGDRWKARSRLPAGTHVPHPQIEERRLAALQLDVGGLDVWLDGVRLGPARTASLRLEPDAVTVAV
jgi:hypothetical protein